LTVTLFNYKIKINSKVKINITKYLKLPIKKSKKDAKSAHFSKKKLLYQIIIRNLKHLKLFR